MPESWSEGELRAALLGAWSVDRRASQGAVRFARVTFYRDGRFGTLAIDGRTMVYGGWRLAPSAQATDGTPRGRLTLHFDHYAAPSAEYLVALAHGPLGPLVLTDPSGGTRLLLARAGSIDASLVGHWRAPPGVVHRGEHDVDAVDLRRDGGFTLRLGGGAVRHGRWTFDHAPESTPATLLGTLVLDPADVELQIERWAISLSRAGVAVLVARRDRDDHELRLSRPALDPVVHALVAHWRLVAPTGMGVPLEVSLRADGTLEVLPRWGAPRAPGRWSFTRALGRPDALEGTLALAVQPHGHPATFEQWRVALGFHRNAELQFLIEDGRTALRYRRIFR
jgi:hypothetical protein